MFLINHIAYIKKIEYIKQNLTINYIIPFKERYKNNRIN